MEIFALVRCWGRVPNIVPKFQKCYEIGLSLSPSEFQNLESFLGVKKT
jgi:hypothetical protein